MNKFKKTNYSRKLFTATMAGVLMVSLGSCSGATNTSGDIPDGLYAKAQGVEINNSELWKELQWSSKDVLDTQITNVVLTDYVRKIELVEKSSFDKLSDSDKELLKVESSEDFAKLKEVYDERLIAYVIQDIYNLNFSAKELYSSVALLTENIGISCEYKYYDEMYANYGSYPVENISVLKDIRINIESTDDAEVTKRVDTLLSIANKYPALYYVSYAKELLSYDKLYEDREEKDSEAEDDDDKYFTSSNYVSKFKSEYVNQFDLDLILIRFNSKTEYDNTLRAFGLKFNSSKLYFIDDEKEGQSYNEYIKYYDGISNSNLGTEKTQEITSMSNNILEIFVQIYNYVYSGYPTRKALPTTVAGVDTVTNTTKTEDLRKITKAILEIDGEGETIGTLEEIIDNLNSAKNSTDTKLTYSREELDEHASSYVTYLYNTLTTPIDGDSSKKCFSTSSQTSNDGYYMSYKLGENKSTLDSTKSKYDELYTTNYNDDTTDYDFYTEHISTDTELVEYLETKLFTDNITETVINNNVNELIEEVDVKIYNEALEIQYSNANSDYSKTVGGAKNKNILATLGYEGKTYNLNIYSDKNDADSIKEPGYITVDGEGYVGAFNVLEQSSGTTTAIDLLSKKLVKTTKAYKDLESERENYKDYLETILYYFANEGYSSSGYPSSIGKYNFLQLYFHTARIDEIIDDYYRVQYASAKILTDYSNETLLNFFKSYSDKLYSNYFSISGSRLVVYYDGNDDGTADDLADWKDLQTIYGTTLGEEAQNLIVKVYDKIASSTTEPATRLDEIVEAINSSSKSEFSGNPIVNESEWAKYKKLGLNVKTEEISATNTTTDIEFSIKERLYNYYTNNNYEFFINEVAPSVFIEKIDDTNKSNIVTTKDGYNLLLVTKADTATSSKWSKDDNDGAIYDGMKVLYNENYYTIENIYNENDKELTLNQIKLYVLDYAQNGSSTLSPTSLQSTLKTFLQPIITRYTSAETQRIALLAFIGDDYTFATEENNTKFKELIKINQNIADNYVFIYDDPTNTSNTYGNWWSDLESIIDQILLTDEEAA